MALPSCSKSGVLHISFNQDCTCVALGSQQGVHIYNVDTHKLCYRYAIGAVSIVEMLFCTSLVGFVGAGEQPALTPRKLTVMNTSTSRTIQELSYPTSILAVRMNRQRLVVMTSRRVHVYSMSNLACLRAIDTEESPTGCCALTCCHEPNLLALPASSATGTVRIYDLAQEGGNVLGEVRAHQTPVTLMSWNADGSLLATASAKGTLIRVHRMPSAARSHSFRRGAMSATIQSMAFGPVGHSVQLLVASSSHGTIHVFRIEEPEGTGAHPRPASAAAGLLSAVVRYSVGDMVEPARNIATIRLPQSVGTAICAFRPSSQMACTIATATATATATAGQVATRLASTGPTPSSSGDVVAAVAAVPVTAGTGTATATAATSCAASAAAEFGGDGGGGAVATSPSRGETAAGFSGSNVRGVGGAGRGSAAMLGRGEEEDRATIMVATQEGLLYEYSLTDLLNSQGPKCTLDGEWSMLGSGSILG
ncbi:hypothetical protein Vretimale_18184 [Volvox reticuliferus]|uniref:Autophagy-related protein 18 n=3 Tax=Volvox reticuliferus TaxID=1737510 RepID=A0A8J4LZ84_9CHLO|nr:hypothetical protein Vretifemale_17994 [Volvox reticuliferus]GIM15443.1 hypothetical protein Vretimale_18184 [Volvox reticuliferus]